METQIIECKLIDVPKVASDVRTFTKEFAVTLADSIKVQGQLNDVLVRRRPGAEDRYLLVAGRHRYYAINNVLKEQFIRAKVLPDDLDAADLTSTQDSENLFRSGLKEAQQAAAVKRWHETWLRKMPALPTREQKESQVGSAGDQSMDCQTDNVHKDSAESSETSDTSTPGKGRKAKEKREKDFDDAVSAATGESMSTVRRTKAIAKAFTEDQLEVFTQMEVNTTDMMTVSRIKDAGKRGEVVNLIASGMTAVDAIKEVMKDQAPGRYNAKTVNAESVAAQTVAVADDTIDAMSDDEWFASECGEKAAMLGESSRYKSDALLWREISAVRHHARTNGKKAAAARKKSGITGPFFTIFNRFISISHPKDWSFCPECAGKGQLSPVDQGDHVTKPRCPKCYGAGYLLKTEEYI